MRRLLPPLLLACLLAPVSAVSAESAEVPDGHHRAAYADAAREDLARVLEGPDFNHRENTLTPHFRYHWRWPGDDAKPTHDALSPWWKKPAEFVGFLFGKLLWILLAVLLILVWRYRQRWLPLLGEMADSLRRRPDAVVRYADPTPEDFAPLPDDIAEAAEQALAAGDPRRALSLLYRGALVTLEARGMPSAPDSATEQDNLRRVRGWANESVRAAFENLVRAWLSVAYAGRPPAGLNSLVTEYRQVFSRRPAA